MAIPGEAKSLKRAGLSLTELLIVVAVIGAITAIALPTVLNIQDAASEATAVQNAKNIESMSQALASLGVAHVIPDSMGGVEATGRLLREGVVVPEGPMAGERFVLSGLSDKAVEDAAKYLTIEYDQFHLRLHFVAPKESSGLMQLSTDVMLCLIDQQSIRLMLATVSRKAIF